MYLKKDYWSAWVMVFLFYGADEGSCCCQCFSHLGKQKTQILVKFEILQWTNQRKTAKLLENRISTKISL